MKVESWRPIPGMGGYEASDAGRVRSLDRRVNHRLGSTAFRRGKVLAEYVHPKWGYHTVNIHGSGRSHRFGVHRLVCMAFHGPTPTAKHMVRHLNGDPGDNRAENLAWGTGTQNQFDRTQHGRNGFANQTHCVNGHRYDLRNTYIRSDGRSRACRTCHRERSRAYRQRKSVA